MKKLTGVIWVSLLVAAITPSGANAQYGRNDRREGDLVCVYENSSFSGWEECYRPGDEVGDMHTHNNKVSSIRVSGRASVSIYDGKNFGGMLAQLNSDVRDMGQLSMGRTSFGNVSWNDRVESFRVGGPAARAPAPPPPPRRDNRRDDRSGRRDVASICVYEDTKYRGRVECFDSGRDISDLGRFGDWSDRISSIRVIGNGRAAAFLDVNYRGDRLVIDNDIPDLKRLRLRDKRTWDNQISSLEVGGPRRAIGRR